MGRWKMWFYAPSSCRGPRESRSGWASQLLVGRGSMSLTEAVKGDEGRHGSMGPSSSPVSRFLIKFQVLGLGACARVCVCLKP